MNLLTSFSDTSRPPRVLEENGNNYWFTDREEMEEEIRQNNFLEYGEHNGHLYGTHLDSIRDVIKDGKQLIHSTTETVQEKKGNFFFH